MSVAIDIKDLPRFFLDTKRVMIEDAVAAIRLTVKTDGLRIVQEEVDKSKPLPVDRGTYRRNWHVSDLPNGAALYNTTPYASIVELGRRPGGRMPPVALIAAWVRRKGIGKFIGPRQEIVTKTGKRIRKSVGRLSDSEQRGIAFLIARSIAKRGIKGHFILKKTEARLAPIVQRAVAESVDKHR